MSAHDETTGGCLGMAEMPPAQDLAIPGKTLVHVWAVDDNKEFRELLARALNAQPGIACSRLFASANALLSALASQHGPDVILLDVHLRGHNGVDSVRLIKSLARRTRVLMFTTFFDGEIRCKARRAGASDFLLKRYPIEEIAARIRESDETGMSFGSHPATHIRQTGAQPRENPPSAEHRLPALFSPMNLPSPARSRRDSLSLKSGLRRLRTILK